VRIGKITAATAALALIALACGGSAVTQPSASLVPPPSQAPDPSVAPSPDTSVEPPSVEPATEAPASQTPASGAPASEAAGPSTVQVAIVDNAFTPATVEVTAGDEVAWTHRGENPHTVTFGDDGPDSGNLSSGGTFRATFDEAGEFSYVCSIHSQMQGTVTVSE